VPVQPLPALARAENTALSLSIPTKAPENLIAISQDALVPVNSGYVVFVAKDGLAEQRIVTLGGTVRDYVVILSGVDAGEEVITKGNEILSDGSKIALPGARADKGAKPGNKSGSWKKQN
jgi:multidrug efflux pump subunit AcrA (membrane-fusion protein)